MAGKLLEKSDELTQRMSEIAEMQSTVLAKRSSTGRGRPGFDITNAESAELFRQIAVNFTFDRNNEIPLWVQLKNLLELKINDGSLDENSRLPSELAMAKLFNLSRPVVRNALSALVSEGLIAKQPRKGIFVAAKKNDFDFMTSATGVFDDLSAKGMEVEERTYEFKLASPDADEQKALRLTDGFKVIRFVRVYVADGTPITHSTISIPAHRVPGMESFDMDNKSIFGTIRKHFGLTAARADRWITAGIADETIAERLEISVGHSLLYIRSVAVDHEGLPLEFYRSYYNADVSPIHISAKHAAD